MPVIPAAAERSKKRPYFVAARADHPNDCGVDENQGVAGQHEDQSGRHHEGGADDERLPAVESISGGSKQQLNSRVTDQRHREQRPHEKVVKTGCRDIVGEYYGEETVPEEPEGNGWQKAVLYCGRFRT